MDKQACKNLKKRRVIMTGTDGLWQANLVEMGNYVANNNG